jgi:hypothetical protein
MQKFYTILIMSLFVGLLSVPAGAQVFELDDDLESDRVLLRKELTGGVVLHNRGVGAQIRFGKNKTWFKSRIIEIEMVSMKHPKQVRVINPYYFNARSYVYGKMNHVYMLRGGYGMKKMLNRKPYSGGVEVRYLLMGGATIAFAKPVYLYFWDESYAIIKEEKYNPDNYYHSSEYIYGRAPFTRGLGELRVYPGVMGKGALNFEFGNENAKIKALEAGVVLEAFPIAIPIMAFNPSQNLFFTFYINFHLGKRYN